MGTGGAGASALKARQSTAATYRHNIATMVERCAADWFWSSRKHAAPSVMDTRGVDRKIATDLADQIERAMNVAGGFGHDERAQLAPWCVVGLGKSQVVCHSGLRW